MINTIAIAYTDNNKISLAVAASISPTPPTCASGCLTWVAILSARRRGGSWWAAAS